jgi:excinuclease ABC subunit A
LHFDDVRKLLEVLHRLADLGNSVVIIEHNLDVIRNADWIIDMGPEGGEDGGRVVAEGRPAQVAGVADSFTGQFLAQYYADHGAPAEAPAELAAPIVEKDPAILARNARREAPKKSARKSATSARPKKATKA